MNSKILQKCIEELAQETPNIAYVRGMLEAMLELSVDKEPSVNASNPYLFTEAYSSNFPNLAGSVNVIPPTTPGRELTPADTAVEMALASIAGMPPPKQGILERNVTLN